MSSDVWYACHSSQQDWCTQGVRLLSSGGLLTLKLNSPPSRIFSGHTAMKSAATVRASSSRCCSSSVWIRFRLWQARGMPTSWFRVGTKLSQLHKLIAGPALVPATQVCGRCRVARIRDRGWRPACEPGSGCGRCRVCMFTD